MFSKKNKFIHTSASFLFSICNLQNSFIIDFKFEREIEMREMKRKFNKLKFLSKYQSDKSFTLKKKRKQRKTPIYENKCDT